MRGIKFAIEWIARDRSYVLARQLDAGDFSFPGGARLGGRIVTAISMPRALDADGRQRADLFAFQVDADGVAIGDVLDLTPR